MRQWRTTSPWAWVRGRTFRRSRPSVRNWKFQTSMRSCGCAFAIATWTTSRSSSVSPMTAPAGVPRRARRRRVPPRFRRARSGRGRVGCGHAGSAPLDARPPAGSHWIHLLRDSGSGCRRDPGDPSEQARLGQGSSATLSRETWLRPAGNIKTLLDSRETSLSSRIRIPSSPRANVGRFAAAFVIQNGQCRRCAMCLVSRRYRRIARDLVGRAGLEPATKGL
jgi:hypothetical protein